jgi:hypothetical protein
VNYGKKIARYILWTLLFTISDHVPQITTQYHFGLKSHLRASRFKHFPGGGMGPDSPLRGAYLWSAHCPTHAPGGLTKLLLLRLGPLPAKNYGSAPGEATCIHVYATAGLVKKSLSIGLLSHIALLAKSKNPTHAHGWQFQTYFERTTNSSLQV